MLKEYNINQTTLRILGLYRGDYRRALHLRHIARETRVDVKAVQLQLKRLERLNILVSRLRGRNKEYCLNLNNSIAKYYVILAETFASLSYLSRNFLIKKVASEISNQIDGTIILFCSFASGQATKESDIDLFIVADRKPLKFAVRETADLIGREISVKSAIRGEFMRGLQDADPVVREVVLEHIILRGVDDFCDIMWRYYARQ